MDFAESEGQLLTDVGSWYDEDMICPKCRSEIPEGVDECIVCGNRAPWFQNNTTGFPDISAIPHIKEQWLLDGTHQSEGSDDTLFSNASFPKLNPIVCFFQGWEMYKKHFRVFFIGMLLTTAISCLLNYSWHKLIELMDVFHGKTQKLFNLLIPDIPRYISFIFAAGLIVMAFKCLDNQTPNISDIFRGFKRWPQLLLCYFISNLFIICGFCFLIIPGIYLVVCYSFAIPLIIDRNINFWIAMKLLSFA